MSIYINCMGHSLKLKRSNWMLPIQGYSACAICSVDS